MDERRRGLSSKYIQFFILAAVFFGFMFFSAPGGENGEWRVYQFSGRNDIVALHHGSIIVTDGFQRLTGGVLTFEEGIYNATRMSYSFFYYDAGERNYHSTVSFPLNPDESMHFRVLSASDTGGMVSPNPRIDNMVDSLHLSVNITFADDTAFESIISLEVRDATQGNF